MEVPTAPIVLPEGAGLDLPSRVANAPGWDRVLDELAWSAAGRGDEQESHGCLLRPPDALWHTCAVR